ncbi:MAG TPA: nitric-oxide reductase large subunit, partial [Usitatibacter sp.]|nr:nitric-oxide reductase large subunit [Usitatibacter sp.]
MRPDRKLWTWLGVVFVLSFAVLLYLGREIYLSAPPYPTVKTESGVTLYAAGELKEGQRAWLAAGGQQLGTVWGHGSYVAPDWSADWLHREAVAYRDVLALKMHGFPYAHLKEVERGSVDVLVRQEMRRNTYDAQSNTVTVSRERAAAIAEVQAHYMSLFGDVPAYDGLREKYAMTANALPREVDRKALSGFFFWSAWSAATDRPGEQGLSYTSNWPHEPIVGNTLPASAAIWSIASVILLIAGIAGMLWFHGRHPEEPDPAVPQRDPLVNAVATPSMKATRKYFFIVIALMLLQILMGVVTAHYAVEGNSFFG